MSAEVNQGSSNLILLCVPHSYEIDDPIGAIEYTVETLISWKADQVHSAHVAVEAVDHPRQGWKVSDSEAAEAIQASESNNSINMNANIIQIGGSGGLLGGGGGGGGVVGFGALIGGQGGDGSIPRIILDGAPGEFPGAGGGGGGVLLSGSVAPPPRIGTEGVSYVAGIDGAPGGDTVVSIDGKEVLRAQGGAAALAGSGKRSNSELISASALLLATHVQVMPHGLAVTVDSGWATLSVLNVPAEHNLPVFCILEAGGAPEGEYTVTFEVRSPTGEVSTSTSIGLVVEKQGDVNRISYAIGLNATINCYGVWRISVSTEARALISIPLMIKRTGE